MHLESKKFIIEPNNIENDGRTTLMIRNIPNKYTQDYLLEEFSTRCSGNIDKFDFWSKVYYIWSRRPIF